MNRDRLETTYDGVEIKSLDIVEPPDHDDGSQEQPQHTQRAEPPLSPWSLIADRDGIWHSDSIEMFGSIGLEGTFNNGREPSVSIGNNEDEGDLSEFLTSKDNTEEEERGIEYDTVLGPGSLAPGPMNSQHLRGNFQSETFHAVPKSPNTCAQSCHAMGQPIESFEEIDARSRPGSPIGLGMSTDNSSIQLPSILISNNVTEDVTDRYLHDLSASYNSVTSPTNQIDMKRNAPRSSYKPVVPIQRNIRPRDLHMYRPNNYEIATHDRQPPDIPGMIGPQCEKIATNSLHAFCVDADSTAAGVAAAHHIDTSWLLVKRRRQSGYLPVFQTRANNLPSLQHRQKPSWNPPTSSALQNSLQVPTYPTQVSTYPTPPLSSRDLPLYLNIDSAYGKDDPPSTQARSSCVSPIEPPSPISPSPSSLPDVADGITRCPSCPDKVFTGTPEAQKNSLQRHNRDAHDGMPRLQCLARGCIVTFAPGRKDNRLKHVRAMHPDYPLPAPYKKRKRKTDSELDSY